tara:strand:- start:5529 stop:5876 length:348 start_codon:yes stop_codon:yes gene_type:complete
MNFGKRLNDLYAGQGQMANVRPAPMPMIEPDPNAIPPVDMPMIEPDPNAIPPVPMPQVGPDGTIGQMSEEEIQNIINMFRQYMNKQPQIGVPEQQSQGSLEDIIGQAVMQYIGGQ